MTAKKKEETVETNSPVKYGIGLDVGTGFLVGAGFKNDKIQFTPLRDAFFSIDKQMFNRTMFNKNQMKIVEIDDKINVIGEDALTLAKIKNTSASRPLSVGIINPKEKNAAPILREMFRYCIERHKKKDGEKMVFSVPGPKIGDADFDVEYHSMSIQSLAKSLNLSPVPLNEAYAVILSELENAEDVTGLGFSFGAGLVNVAFVYKSMLLFQFSIDKSGDYIDSNAAKMCGTSESMISHIKENELDLTMDEFSASAEIRSLIFSYKYVIRNTIKEVVRAFNETENVNIVDPIPMVVSGGTSLPKGFLELFENECKDIKLPFNYTEIIPADNRLASVAKGCLLWANYLEENNE